MAKLGKGKRRLKLINTKALAKEERMKEHEGKEKSNYARKVAFLNTQARKGKSSFGADYPERPWK